MRLHLFLLIICFRNNYIIHVGIAAHLCIYKCKIIVWNVNAGYDNRKTLL